MFTKYCHFIRLLIWHNLFNGMNNIIICAIKTPILFVNRKVEDIQYEIQSGFKYTQTTGRPS